MKISYHVSHEQFSPRALLDLVRMAESAGFDCAFSSDHIQPWTPAQGQAGHLWGWLGAALQATQRLTFSAITIPGGWRYHPAVTAQAIATIGEMFPGRLPWIALGSGEALNECVVAAEWPDKAERNLRLRESADIIRALLRGECVTRSAPIAIANARVWSRPSSPALLVGAALSEATASEVADWADGLLTVASDIDQLAAIVAAFRRRSPDKPMHAKVDVCWAPTEAEALRLAHEQWAHQCVPKESLADLRTPEQFERAAQAVTPEQVRKVVFVSADLSRHVEWLRTRAALGFETLDIHNVGRNQQEFIAAYGSHVLPALRS